MGLLSKLKGEFIDIVEWLDDTNDTLVWRFPRYENEIKYGAKLVVRESQNAAFVNEGQLADVFTPGTFTLETQNVPILSTLKGWKYGFHSPFKAEVYFCSMRQFTDRKWGTKNPVMMRDPEFGPIRLRAFGSYAFKVKDPAKLIRQCAGTDAKFSTEEITEQLKNIIITRFTDTIAESKIPALDLAAKYDEFSEILKTKINPEYDEYGLELTKLLIENISFPPEVEKAIDSRSSMGVIGNLNQYMQYQTAQSIETAAANPGGLAAGGMGMGMGFAMANQMGQNMNNPQQQGPPPPPVPQQVMYYVLVNGAQQGPFGETALQQMVQQGTLKTDTMVWKQGMPSWVPANQCPDLTNVFNSVPPPPPPPVPNP
ncbi:MAG: SPFH domain-containing protein [Bacteroidota bacterium]